MRDYRGCDRFLGVYLAASLAVGLSSLVGCVIGSGEAGLTGGSTSVGGASVSGGSSGAGGARVESGGAAGRDTANGGTGGQAGAQTSVVGGASGGVTTGGRAGTTGGALGSGGTELARSGGAGGRTAEIGAGGSAGRTGTGTATAAGGRTGAGGTSGSGGAGALGGATGTGGNTSAGTAVPSAGCGKTSAITFGSVPGESGTSVGTGEGGYVKIGSRGFAMRLPDNYDKNKPYWLIFGFHWNGGNSKEVDTGGSNGYVSAHFGLQKLSKNGAIFVAPDGLNAGWANSGGQDLQLVDDMVKLIEDNYCVDTTRLYANGFSYGGGMSYAIACARAKVFRAVAIYEGAQLSGCEGGNDPIAFWQMAGTTDNTCSISMATPMRDKFAKNNGCTIPATEPSRPKSITDPHICTDYTGCSTGHPLRWCVHPAGHGNAIVDGTSDLYNSCATPPKTCSDTCKCTWVPADVWSFFTSL